MRIAVLNELKNSLDDLEISFSDLSADNSVEYFQDTAELYKTLDTGWSFEVLVWVITSVSDQQQRELREMIRACPGMQIIFISSFVVVPMEEMAQSSLYFISLQKPAEYFREALELAIQRRETRSANVLSIGWNKIRYFIPYADILYCERVHRITLIHTPKEIFRTAMKLAELEEQLPSYFESCHKSYIVNLRYIQQVSQTELHLKDGTVIPISRSKTAEFTHNYEQYLGCGRKN